MNKFSSCWTRKQPEAANFQLYITDRGAIFSSLPLPLVFCQRHGEGVPSYFKSKLMGAETLIEFACEVQGGEDPFSLRSCSGKKSITSGLMVINHLSWLEDFSSSDTHDNHFTRHDYRCPLSVIWLRCWWKLMMPQTSSCSSMLFFQTRMIHPSEQIKTWKMTIHNKTPTTPTRVTSRQRHRWCWVAAATNSVDHAPTSPWSNWTSSKGSSKRRTTQTHSCEKSWVSDSACPKRAFKWVPQGEGETCEKPFGWGLWWLRNT